MLKLATRLADNHEVAPQTNIAANVNNKYATGEKASGRLFRKYI
jgi:hypothetical protein